MDLLSQLKPFFSKRPPRRIEGLSNDEYLQIPAVNYSLLKEKTSADMACRILGLKSLPLELQRLIELRGGDASDVMELVEQETPRTVPRNFLRLGTAEIPAKLTDAQQKLVDALKAGEVDCRDAHSGTVKSFVTKGWAERFVKEVTEQGVSEDVKASRAEALVMGTVFHMCILEKHRFESDLFHKEWQLSPTKSLVSKEALAALAEDPTRKLITPEIVDRARRIGDAVWEHKEAARILSLPGKSEVAFEVWDEGSACMRKLKVDWLPDSMEEGELDLKKTHECIDNESDDTFDGQGDWRPRAIIKRWNYALQRVFYADTLAMVERRRRPHSRILLATDHPPYKVRLFDMEGVEDTRSLLVKSRGIYMNRMAKFTLAYLDNQFEQYENEGCVTLADPVSKSFLP
jgi:hypothetical protein